jgi:hypothetical protein
LHFICEEYLQTVNAKYHTGNHTQKWLNKEFSKANADEFMDKVFRTDITIFKLGGILSACSTNCVSIKGTRASKPHAMVILSTRLTGSSTIKRVIDEAFAGYFWYPRMQSESGSEFERFAKHYVDRPYEEYLQTVNAKYHTGNHTQKWLNNSTLT